jgi:hypothetical protein
VLSYGVLLDKYLNQTPKQDATERKNLYFAVPLLPTVARHKALSVLDRSNTETASLYPVWDVEPPKYINCNIIPYLRH